ncbi:MAG: 5-methyltetrahydropteroyltriglutamate--homocysteine methyltransferase, partial [Deltaproteobacteria bacterium]|nr:5-methyltetrahydropteroyltriglutamate--homocysteine methyltransferase [Deltaproteobacteria bacterium]
MTGNELVSEDHGKGRYRFLVSKGKFVPSTAGGDAGPVRARMPGLQILPVQIPDVLPPPAPAPAIAPLSVMGIGSWPRPRWMLQALHQYLDGRMPEAEFQATADDAAQLALDAQVAAGVDVVTDGEQRRDSYASFVASRLDNCQLV